MSSRLQRFFAELVQALAALHVLFVSFQVQCFRWGNSLHRAAVDPNLQGRHDVRDHAILQRKNTLPTAVDLYNCCLLAGRDFDYAGQDTQPFPGTLVATQHEPARA